MNCLSRGDQVLALQSGMFGEAWAEMAKALGLEVEILTARPRRAIDPDEVEGRLRADREGRIKAVLAVQIDTAAGLVNDIPAIRQAVTDAGHPALFMVDTIASLACMPYEMDAWDIDVTVAGSQKGLMTPPGLAFVAAGERARAAHRHAGLVTRYWDWSFREGEEHYQKYCGTAPEHLMFGLRRALDMLLEEGLQHVFRRHALLADATRAAVARWSEGGAFDFNVIEPAERSNSVTTIRFDGCDPKRVLDFCLRHCGVVLAHRNRSRAVGTRRADCAHGACQRAHDSRCSRHFRDGADRSRHSPWNERFGRGGQVARGCPRGGLRGRTPQACLDVLRGRALYG